MHFFTRPRAFVRSFVSFPRPHYGLPVVKTPIHQYMHTSVYHQGSEASLSLNAVVADLQKEVEAGRKEAGAREEEYAQHLHSAQVPTPTSTV